MENDEEDIHIVEYETEVSNLDATINILKGVRINKVCDLIKERDSFIYKNLFEISLDNVKDLGYFIEIEVYDKNIPIILDLSPIYFIKYSRGIHSSISPSNIIVGGKTDNI